MRLTSFVLALAALGAVHAVDTRFWTFATKADHEKAKLTRLSLASDGAVQLAPAVRELHDAGVSYLWAAAVGADGTVYTGGGNPGATKAKLFAWRGGQSRVLAELDGLQIQAIALDPQGRVYAATAPDGKVFRVNADGKTDAFYDPKSKYIWALVFDSAGNLYVATGDQGEIHKVTPGGQGSVWFRTEEEHARSMARDKSGNLIVGTEPGGLILRITPGAEGFILYQSSHREVTALAVGADGTIFAAAAGSKPAARQPAPPPAPIAAPAPTSITVTASGGGSTAPAARPAAPPPPTLSPANVGGGSELIAIAPDGMPQTWWSDSAEIIYTIVLDGEGRPVVGTGNKGALYRVESSHRSVRLLTLEPTQVTGLAASGGTLYAVTGNIGKLFQVGPELEKDGVYESEVLDAGWFAEWGRLTKRATGTVRLETRSGNVDRPQKNWSPWAATPDRIASPAARFVQFRATLSGANAGMRHTELAYLPRNVAPRVEAIEITAPNYRFPSQSLTITPPTTLTLGPMSSPRTPSAAAPSTDPGSVTLSVAQGMQGARWKAGDANGDSVEYTVEVRGTGETAWKKLRDGLGVRQYSWDASAFPDGEYRIRVTASDAGSNAPGRGLSHSLESEPFLIDNSAPVIQGLTAAAAGTNVRIRFAASDALTVLTRAEFSINAGEWQYLEPSTKLTDAKEHAYDALVSRPAAGELTIAVRVTDEFGNTTVAKTVLAAN